MTYGEVVKRAQKIRKEPYDNGKIFYKPCEVWLKGDQINLWTYWQGYQLKDIDENHVDILLVGQDWGNPDADSNKETLEYIKQIQTGNTAVRYNEEASTTDKNLKELFKVFDENIDISQQNPGMRLFFTNYSLGYRSEKQTGGMTKTLMLKDKEFFDLLVVAVRPKIIICLGKLTYEVASGQIAKDFSKKLQRGEPFRNVVSFGKCLTIPVYGVAHCGSFGTRNAGGFKKMQVVWEKIAEEYRELEEHG